MRSTPASRPASRSASCSPNIVNVAGVAPIIIYSAAEDRVVTIPGLGPWPKAIDARLLPEAPWRQDSAGRAAHRGAGGARCLDHGARALRHHELRRGRAIGDRLRARRLSGLSADVGDHHRARGRVPRVSVERRALSAARAPAAAGRGLRADGARRHHAVHGGPGGRGARTRARGRPRGGARRLLSRRHRAGDRQVPEGERRLPVGRGSRGLSLRLRGAGRRPRSATSGSLPAARGARGRRCCRRSTSSTAPSCASSATTPPATCTASPRR